MTASSGASAATILLSGGLVADGVGPDFRQADVLVRAGRIAAIEPGLTDAAARVDVSGCVVLPGFVDAHIHADAAVFDPEVQAALAHQGVTSVVLGQDGLSFAPSLAGFNDSRRFVERYFAAINGTHPRFAGGTVADLLDTYDGAATVNCAYLVPHGTVRFAVMGAEPSSASEDQIVAMVELVRDGLDNGARGMSTGLEYAPGCYAETAELTALCQLLAARGMPHVTHMRGYGAKAVPAVGELAALARTTGVATHIAHYHGPADELAPAIDALRAEGLHVTFDSYPYLRGASILALIALPTWLPLADPDQVVALLADPSVVDRLRSAEFPARADLWDRVTLSYVPHPDYRWCEGLPLAEVAGRLGKPPEEAALDLLVATRLEVGCVFGHPSTNSMASVDALAQHEAHCAGSDGIYLGARPHPRGWGTFARFLARHVVESGDWSWQQAARHLATTAAERFALHSRGRLVAGYHADVAVVDPQSIRDQATYEHPRVTAAGVRHVLVNGAFVLHDGEPTGILAGTAIR
jgi:N-acyl-D-amino-acid deacylase